MEEERGHEVRREGVRGGEGRRGMGGYETVQWVCGGMAMEAVLAMRLSAS